MRISRSFAKVFLTFVFAYSFTGSGGTADAQPLGKEALRTPKFDFALIGDLPYTAEQEPKYVNLINDINEYKLAFTVHDGDFKSGSTLCSDQVFY